jgi:SAM-dependent methyltransferase
MAKEDSSNFVSLNKKAWDRIADRYDDRDDLGISEVFGVFMELLPENGRVLDLGCGTGLPYAKILVEKGFETLGVDVSPNMISIAKENVPGAEFIEVSMTEIDFEDEFDGVVSSFSMLLLDPPLFVDVARRAVRSLMPDGLLFLALNEPPKEGVDPDVNVVVEIMGEKMYSRAYTVDEVLGAFEPIGMDKVEFRRKVQCSKEFGEEHVIEFIFQKV